MSDSAAPFIYRRFQIHRSLLREALPSVLSLEVTNHCNLCCSHCGHSRFPDFVKGHVEEALFERISHALGPGKIPSLSLTIYGESLLSPQFWKVFSRARAIPGLRIGFITNAVLLDRHLEKLDHPDLDIIISMDGASERTYSHFRGSGYFDKVVRNLELLREREASGALPASGRTFFVVLSQINAHEMPAIVEMAAQLGARRILFAFQIFFDADCFRRESLFFARNLYDHWLSEAARRASELGVTLIHPDAFDGSLRVASEEFRKTYLWRDEQGMIQCGVIRDNCYVKFHGQVEACCVPDRYLLGNLLEDSLYDIWHGPYYRRLRRSFQTGDWTVTCHNCNLLQSVDVHREQSHFVLPMCDGGELHSLPQPYRITEVEKRYGDALRNLERQPEDPGKAMPTLLRLAALDEGLYEVLNAIAVIWLNLEQPEKGVTLLRKAARIAPKDPVMAHNLGLVDDFTVGVGFSGERAEEMVVASRPVRFHQSPTRYLYELFPLDWRDARLDALWQRVGPGLGLAVVRDREHLAWRFQRHPLHTYRLWGLRRRWSRRLAGWAVIRDMGETLYVMDLLFEGSPLPLIEKLDNMAVTAGKPSLTLRLPSRYRSLLKARGFALKPTGIAIPQMTPSGALS